MISHFRNRSSRRKREREDRLFSLGSQEFDFKLKDRLDYAYRNFQALRDFCLWLGIFFVTTVVSFYSFLSGHVTEYPELRAGTSLGYDLSGCFFVCFCLLFWELLTWYRKQAPLFRISKIPEPPSSLVFAFTLLFLCLCILFARSFATMPLSWRFPPPPMPSHLPAP